MIKFKIQNSKFKIISKYNIWKLKIGNWKFRPEGRRGIALLLTIFILTAVLSISIGTFSYLYGELIIIGSVEDSFMAINASDHGVERTVYRDRMIAPLPDGTVETGTALPSGACYDVQVVQTGAATEVRVVGEYQCGNVSRGVKRAFRVTY